MLQLHLLQLLQVHMLQHLLLLLQHLLGLHPLCHEALLRQLLLHAPRPPDPSSDKHRCVVPQAHHHHLQGRRKRGERSGQETGLHRPTGQHELSGGRPSTLPQLHS